MSKDLCLEVRMKIMTVANAYDILDRVTNIAYRNASATVVGSFAYLNSCAGYCHICPT
jgi:hypothetical protein